MTEHLNALPEATLLQEFELLGVLGSGGFGITYLGQDRYLEKKVAIKEYMPIDIAIRQQGVTVRAKTTMAEDTENFAWGLKAFLQEARILAQFQHPNIIQIHRFFEANGTAYIVMDYVEGETLHTRLERQGRLNEPELKELLLPLMDGLKKVHEAGILHRDIKPANIIIRNDGSPLLIDFGAARQKINNRTKSQPITALITPGYAPMEQYHSSGHLGAWSDIYAMAAVAYHCLSGGAPPEAPARIRRDPYKPAQKYLKPQASDKFLKAVDWGMQIDEEKRPQNLDEWEASFSSKTSVVGGGNIPYPLIITGAAVSMILIGVVYTGYYLYQLDKEQQDDPVPVIADDSIDTDMLPDIPEQPVIDDQESQPPVDDIVNAPGISGQGGNITPEEEAALSAQSSPAVPPTTQTNTQTAPAQQQEDVLAGTMLLIKAGCFQMGSPASESGRFNTEKRHNVCLSKDFWIGKYEVTQKQWQAIMGSNPSIFKQCGNDCPVENVSWQNVQTFISKLNQQTGQRYRLPTEAEWEYAARAGTTTAVYNGNLTTTGTNVSKIAWYNANSVVSYSGEDCLNSFAIPGKSKAAITTKKMAYTPKCGTHPVGQKQGNAFGLHDTAGNVWEWIQDKFDLNYYQNSPSNDPTGPAVGQPSRRVIRGGSWQDEAIHVRAANRRSFNENTRSNILGFRLAKDK